MEKNIKQIATIEYVREGDYETIDIEIGGFEWNDTFGVYVEKSDYRGALFLSDIMKVHLREIGKYLFVEIPVESVVKVRFEEIEKIIAEHDKAKHDFDSYIAKLDSKDFDWFTLMEKASQLGELKSKINNLK